MSKDSDKKENKESKQEDNSPPAEWEGHFDKVLEALKLDLVKELLEANNVKVTSNTKKKVIEGAMKLCQKEGEKLLFDSLDKETSKAVLEGLDEKVDHDNKSKMLSEVKAQYNKLGQEKFLKKLPLEVLTKLCEKLEFKEEGSKEEVEAALAEELISHGAVLAFSALTKEYCVDVAKNLKLKTSGSKSDLVHRVVGQAFPHLLENDTDQNKKKKEKKKESENLKPITKECSKEDLYQYYIEDLQEFCKKNNIKKHGTKKSLVTNIMKFFAGEDVAPLKPGEKNKKKQTAEEKKKEKEEKQKAIEEAEKEFQEKVKAIKRKRAEELAVDKQPAKKQRK